MKRTVIMLALAVAVGMTVGVIADQVLSAQHIKVTDLLKADLAGLEGKEAVVQTVEIAPAGVVGKHYHPGHEVVYVLGGTGTLEMEGRPPRVIKPGDVVHIPAKHVHWANNNSMTHPVVVLVVRIHEKGQPITIPVQ